MFWFQGEKTSRPSEYFNLFVNHLIAISQILSQMWIIMEKNLRYSLLSNHINRHLGLVSASRTKPFSNPYFTQGWHKTSHMPTSRTPITYQYSDCPYKFAHNIQQNNNQGSINLAINIRKMTYAHGLSMFYHLSPPTTTFQNVTFSTLAK
jgi:hypothetical protein